MVPSQHLVMKCLSGEATAAISLQREVQTKFCGPSYLPLLEVLSRYSCIFFNNDNVSFSHTVPCKCKLTVPRNSNDSTRLDPRNSKISSIEVRVESFEFRVENFEFRVENFEFRDENFEFRDEKERVFRAINFSRYFALNAAVAVILGALKSWQGFHANEVALVALLFFIASIFIFKMISL